MTYLHCHTKDCGWSQDDFYSMRYNPLTKIWSSIKWLIKPRNIGWDFGFVEYEVPNLIKRTGINVKFKKRIKIMHESDLIITTEKNNDRICEEYYCFSWNWLLLEIVKDIKVGLEQKWWTYKAWKKDLKNSKAKCPKCGLKNFDID